MLLSWTEIQASVVNLRRCFWGQPQYATTRVCLPNPMLCLEAHGRKGVTFPCWIGSKLGIHALRAQTFWRVLVCWCKAGPPRPSLKVKGTRSKCITRSAVEVCPGFVERIAFSSDSFDAWTPGLSLMDPRACDTAISESSARRSRHFNPWCHC